MNGDLNEERMYGVALETVGVRVQKAVDPEVSALLEDTDDASRFGSDVEDLEEDFILQANAPKDNEEASSSNKGLNLCEQFETKEVIYGDNTFVGKQIVDGLNFKDGVGYRVTDATDDSAVEKPRVPRPLDEQFDIVSPVLLSSLILLMLSL